MRAIYILVFLLQFSFPGLAQVTVINPTNTTPNLAATYTSLNNAITALNAITSISGPVTITLNAGNPQTAPAGGYVIQFSASTTAANSITITGSNNTITAFASQTAGNLNDGIFKIIGADYVTIQNFMMQENGANTTTTAGTNNMTEFGVALFRVSATDGAQHNTIQNNTISLSLTYSNTFGIYSNSRSTASAVTATADITNVSGSNLGNKIYSNAISNVNYGIIFNGSATAAYMDDGNDIGGSSLATGNTITNWGISAAASAYVNLTGSNYAVFMNHQVNENVSYNTITGATHTTTNTIGGILKNYSVAVPTGITTSTISYNTITVTSSNATAFMQVIQSASVAAASSTIINITYNIIQNCAVTGVATTAQFVGILNSWAPGILNISNNTLKGNSSTSTNAIFQGITNSGAVATTVNINNNKLGITGTGLISCTNANAQAYNCILNSAGTATATININNNSIDGISVVTTGAFNGIVNTATAPVAVNMNYNQLGSVTGTMITFSGAQSNTFTGMNSSAGSATGTSSVQYNDVRGIVHVASGTNDEYYIYTNRAVKTGIVSNNTFTNISAKTSGAVYMIFRGDNMSAGQSYTCNYNSIVTGFSKTVLTGVLYCFYSAIGSDNGSNMIQTGNNFSNITVVGTIYGWYNQEGISASACPTKTLSNNIFDNWTTTSGSIVVAYLQKSAGGSVTGNTISNIHSAGSIMGIRDEFGGQGTIDCSYNTIYNLDAAPGFITGIEGGSFTLPVWNIHHNSIYNFTCANASAPLMTGIDVEAGMISNVYNNEIHDFVAGGDSFFGPLVNGITFLGGTSSAGPVANVYNNKIYSLTTTGNNNSSGVVVNGIYSRWGATNNFYNNFISDLNAPNTNYGHAICGINISAFQVGTYNLYYNSIYLNASSTGIDFGTSGIYHESYYLPTYSVLNMIDNIVKNTSTANFSGKTVAYRLSQADLSNFNSTSDYNMYYAGTPSASNLIFYDGTNSDQTLTAYQSRVSPPREVNSLSASPNFVSITDLHIPSTNCTIDGKGTPIAGYTTDIDADIRDVATPDMGADEFTVTYGPTLAGVVGLATCSDKIVSPAGTVYGTNSCDLIAKVLPSGGAPASGNIHACVTLDASQQYFNGEPYLQRHFDIEPATNPATVTATVTLFFSNAEFLQYNSMNPVYPTLPTIGAGNTVANRGNVRITQFHGVGSGSPTSPGNYPGTRVLITPGSANVVLTGGSYWAVSFPVTGFSGFYAHTTLTNVPLPVIVNYLTGRRQGSNHLLNWKVTCTSSPHATMVLERSGDAQNYTAINSITADAARCNQPFDYTDIQPLNGMNYYRLKIIDADGKITFSNSIALINGSKGFALMNIAPNPVTGNSFKLNTASATKTKMQLVISDMQGRMLNRQTIPLIAGFNSIDINVSTLSPGTYNIYGITADEKSGLIRFVKQ